MPYLSAQWKKEQIFTLSFAFSQHKNILESDLMYSAAESNIHVVDVSVWAIKLAYVALDGDNKQSQQCNVGK